MEKKPTVTIQNNNPKQSYNSVSSYAQNLITQDKEKSLKFNRINTVMDSNMKNKADKKSNKNNFFNQSNLLSIFGIKGGEEGKVSEHKSSNFQDDAQNLDPQVVNKKITELSDKNSRAQSQHNNSFGEKEPKHKKKVFEYKEDFYSLLKRAEQIDTNRKIIKENYIKSGRNKMSIINKWKEILKNMKYFDVALYIHCFKILGDIKIEFDEYELAKNNYLCHKYLAYRLELLDELMLGYEGLGHVYKFLYQYHKAIKCYKKQIEIAWVLKDTRYELLAYDNIGIQYFYLGNRDKARYYHERMMNGIVEPENDLKRKTIEQFKEKNFNFFITDEKEVERLKPIAKNEELLKNLEMVFELFQEDDTETIEYKLQDGLKNSNISESDITFNIMNSEFLNLNSKLINDSDEEDNCHSKRQIAMTYSRKIMPGSYVLYRLKKKSKHSKKLNLLNEMKSKEGSLADNMILSHLSLKRKEADIERFDKIFEQFNKKWVAVKKNLGLMK